MRPQGGRRAPRASAATLFKQYNQGLGVAIRRVQSRKSAADRKHIKFRKYSGEHPCTAPTKNRSQSTWTRAFGRGAGEAREHGGSATAALRAHPALLGDLLAIFTVP